MNMMRYLYQKGLKPVLFRFDPELVHDVFVRMGEVLGKRRWTRHLVAQAYGYRGPDASVVIDGIRYETPVILAAGFDYNGRLIGILKSMGFGGVEVGSVTARPTAGNPPPRMTRLVKSKSLVVNKGLRNDGVEVVAKRLKEAPREPGLVVGVSIARTNDEQAASLEGGIEDYRTTLAHLVAMDVGDFYTINISCPNIHGGESFTHPERLRRLLASLADVKTDRPIYVKMPINASWDEFDGLLRVIDQAGLQGVVIGNLNKNYGALSVPTEAPSSYRGGLSGRPCFAPSNYLIHQTREHYGDRFTIMGCGGVMTTSDAQTKFHLGADLVQLISGMIFEGPHLMKEIDALYSNRRRRTTAGKRLLDAQGVTINS
jgi:dihydroorotate dehydrogenase